MAEKKLTFSFHGKFQNLQAGIEKAKSALATLDGMVKSIGDKFSLSFGQQKVTEFSEFADKINDISQKTGESVEEIQKWNNAINAAGGDAESFNKVLGDLADELNVPWQDGNLKAMFRTLGVQAHDASGKMRKPLDMISDLSGKLKGMDDSSVMTFGEKFGFDQKTINLLKDGQGQLAQYLDKGKKMGIFSKEEIKRGAELRKTFTEIKTASTLLGLQIGSALTPVAKALASAFQSISGWFRENERVVKAGMIIGAFLGIIKAIKAFDLAAKISALTNPYVLLFAAIVAALALLVEDFLAFKEGAEHLMPWNEILEGGKAFIDGFMKIGEKIGNVIASLFTGEGILESLAEFGNEVENIFNGIADIIIGVFSHAFDFITDGFKKITGKLGGALNTVKGWFGFGGSGDTDGKIPSVPDSASVQNSNSSVVNNANRTMTIQKLEIKADNVDSESFSGIAEKAAGFNTFQANYGG